jgi:hypothetical protein
MEKNNYTETNNTTVDLYAENLEPGFAFTVDDVDPFDDWDELSEEEKTIRNSEDKLCEKLSDESGRDFGFLVLRRDEKATLFKESRKSIKAALEYIPIHINLLKDYDGDPYDRLYRCIDAMELANYTDEDIEAFSLTWLNAVEDCLEFDSEYMKIYLLGGIYFYGDCMVSAPCKRDFKRALEFLPTWLQKSDLYDADNELDELIYCMRKVGYSVSDISLFATRYISESMMNDKLCYSSMYMRLFSEHKSGAFVNIDGLADFEQAIAFLPTYVDYIIHDCPPVDEYQTLFDPDRVLCNLILKMRIHDFPEKQIARFVHEWMRALEKTGNDSVMRMFSYLCGEYSTTYSSRQTGHKIIPVEVQLDNMKDFEKALDYIPSWMSFINDPGVRYYFGYDSDSIIMRILKIMRDSGYDIGKIEEFLLRAVECDNSLNKVVAALYKYGKYKNVEFADLKDAEKHLAFVSEYGNE